MLKVVSQLFVEIIKCELDFPLVAMGEPDPCREPLPQESRYSLSNLLENIYSKSTTYYCTYNLTWKSCFGLMQEQRQW